MTVRVKAIRSWLALGLLAGALTFAVTSGSSCGSDSPTPSDPGTAGSGSDPGTGGTTGTGGGTAGTTGTGGSAG